MGYRGHRRGAVRSSAYRARQRLAAGFARQNGPPQHCQYRPPATTPNGVFVIDAKRYRGRPTLIVEGGLFRPRIERLTVAGRDRTKVVDGVIKQVEVVRALVGPDVPVRGVLCFVEADWPLVGGSFTTREVDVLWPKKLYRLLRDAGPMPNTEIATIHRVLAESLHAAA